MEDWSDLLHPALRRKVGIVESPREVPLVPWARVRAGCPPALGVAGVCSSRTDCQTRLQVLSVALRTLGLPPDAGPEQLRAAGISEQDVFQRLKQLRQQVFQPAESA